MTPKELIQAAMPSHRSVAHGTGMLERAIDDNPDLKALVRAVFMTYLMEKYLGFKIKLRILSKRRNH